MGYVLLYIGAYPRNTRLVRRTVIIHLLQRYVTHESLLAVSLHTSESVVLYEYMHLYLLIIIWNWTLCTVRSKFVITSSDSSAWKYAFRRCVWCILRRWLPHAERRCKPKNSRTADRLWSSTLFSNSSCWKLSRSMCNDVRMWSGLNWLRIAYNGGFFWTLPWTFWEIVAQLSDVSVSRGGICTIGVR